MNGQIVAGDQIKVVAHTRYIRTQLQEHKPVQHNGYSSAIVSAVYDDGSVEIEVSGGYDLVSEERCTKL